MDNVKELLFEALELAQQQGRKQGNMRLAPAIGAVLNQNFPDKGTSQKVSLLLGAKRPKQAHQDNLDSKVEEWKPGKRQNAAKPQTSTVDPAAEVDEDIDDTGGDGTEDPNANSGTGEPDPGDDGEKSPLELSEMSDEDLLEHFGGVKSVKEFSKLNGFEIPMNKKTSEFLRLFKESCKLLAEATSGE